MTNVRNDERRLEILEARHFRADDRYLDKMERADREIEKAGMIGELCREGKPVFYINLMNRDGRLTGKTKEATGPLAWYELRDYLIRNKYV